jgi:hypothetical protein
MLADVSVEELDTHPDGAGRLERGTGPGGSGSGGRGGRGGAAYELDAAPPDAEGPDRPPPLRERLRACAARAVEHRASLLRGTALVAAGAVLGAGLVGERTEARERAAREDLVDLEFAGTVDAPVERRRDGDGLTAVLRLRNEGPLPLRVVGARAQGERGLRFTGVDEGSVPAGGTAAVRLRARVDCEELSLDGELDLVLEVAARSGRVADVPVEPTVEGTLGPWNFGWCVGADGGERSVEVAYGGAQPGTDPATFTMVLSLTSREDEVLHLRGVEPPFPSVDPLPGSGVQEVAELPPGRTVEVPVRITLPPCEVAETSPVTDGLSLYVVEEDEELFTDSTPSVYASGGTRMQRDLLDAIDRRCPRGG